MASGTYAIVEQVRVEHVDDKNVSFSTRARLSGLDDDFPRKTFTCATSEVWTAPIAGAPAPVAMAPGEVGNLYLSRAGWATKTVDGYKIYSATGEPIFKYPDAAAAPRMVSSLSVIPSRIIVRGMLEGHTQLVEIDLLGADAAQAQDIVWRGSDDIELRLTERGARHLHLRAGVKTAKLWPTKITVAGAPSVAPTTSGEVNLLDGELAAPIQHLEFAVHGAPVELALTQDGFAAFHVVPGLEHAPRRHENPHHG